MQVLSLLATIVCAQSTSIDHYLQNDIRDLSFTTRVLKADQTELKKVNNDFGMAYRFDTVKVVAKEPFRVRLDASVEDTSMLYLINGTNQMSRIPAIHFHQKVSLVGKPGRRQTVFDFGLLTPSLFDSYLDAKFVRVDRETGDPVFDVTYREKNDKSRSRIWIDPARRIISKREWYNQSDRQLATFYYTKPVQVSDVWLPTRVEVKNVDDKIAGITQYSDIRVNSGISDDRFTIQ